GASSQRLLNITTSRACSILFMALGGTCVVDVLPGKPGSDRAHYGDIRTAFKRRLASRSTTDIENSPRYGH
ncbi:MAG: hypothetical protein AAB315_03615, partial [Pseudomonadota bacterium]